MHFFNWSTDYVFWGDNISFRQCIIVNSWLTRFTSVQHYLPQLGYSVSYITMLSSFFPNHHIIDIDQQFIRNGQIHWCLQSPKSILLQGLYVYVWVNIHTLSPLIITAVARFQVLWGFYAMSVHSHLFDLQDLILLKWYMLRIWS